MLFLRRLLYLPVLKSFYNEVFSDKLRPFGKWWLFIILVIIFIPHIFISYGLIDESVMSDLHGRVIGSRLLEAKRPCYFFEWKAGDDPKLFDPNISFAYGLNGVTVTPFMLWLQLPLMQKSFCEIKFWWWVLEELLLFATLLFTWFISENRLKQIFTILLSCFFFCYSRNWWLHIYNGQYYILFGYFFSLSAYLQRRNGSVALFAYPFAILLRPFFIISIIPLLIKHFSSGIRWLFLGSLISLLLFIGSGTYRHIPEYTKAMGLYSSEVTGWSNIAVKSTETDKPIILEKCVMKITTAKDFGAGCLFAVQHYFKLFGVVISNPYFFSTLLILVLIFVLWLSGINKSMDNDILLLISFLLYIVCELFTPANRNPYNMIQYLGILGLFVNRASGFTLSLFTIGLLFNHDFPFRFQYQRELGEGLILLSIFLVILSSNKKLIFVNKLFG